MIMKMSSACNSSICIRLGTDHLTCGGSIMVFYFRSEIFFRTTQELEYLFFPPVFNIRLYDKNSESDYFFFPPPKSEYFFKQHWESEYFFRKKTIAPPWKLNGPSLVNDTDVGRFKFTKCFDL